MVIKGYNLKDDTHDERFMVNGQLITEFDEQDNMYYTIDGTELSAEDIEKETVHVVTIEELEVPANVNEFFSLMKKALKTIETDKPQYIISLDDSLNDIIYTEYVLREYIEEDIYELAEFINKCYVFEVTYKKTL